MSKLNKIGYISLIGGVALVAIALTTFNKHAEGSQMVEDFFCLSSMCLSRAEVFFPIFIIGYLLLAFSLALLGEQISKNLMRFVFGK